MGNSGWTLKNGRHKVDPQQTGGLTPRGLTYDLDYSDTQVSRVASSVILLFHDCVKDPPLRKRGSLDEHDTPWKRSSGRNTTTLDGRTQS